jgi:hypothetical protein
MVPPRARPATQDRLPKASLKDAVQVPDIIEIESTPEPEPIPIFRLDGVLWSIPGRVPAGLTLQVMEDMGTIGEQAAMVRALRELMGEDAYAALKGCRYLTPDQLGAVMDKVMDQITGAVEAASGK